MLTSITLKDYTTFIGETKIDFRTTDSTILNETNTNNKVLKGCLFVGENASGKTQILMAIKMLLDLLFSYNDVSIIRKKSMYTKGVKYELKYAFLIDNSEIEYDIVFSGSSIDSEKLTLNSELLLERRKKSGKTYYNHETKIIQKINEKLLLLKQEYYNTRFENNKILNKWFDFLKNSVYVNCLFGKTITYDSTAVDDLIPEKYAEKNTTEELNTLLAKFGYNSELVFNKKFSNIDDSIVINAHENIIGVRKKGTDLVMPLQFESTGNKVLINVLLPILHSIRNNSMLLIDEFSSGMHNELEEALIRFFFNNSKKSQLFFVSHSTNILDTFILRPDQIYSLQFVPGKGTIINRFSDEKPRESQNIEKMYLGGVFDGLPKYSKEFKIK